MAQNCLGDRAVSSAGDERDGSVPVGREEVPLSPRYIVSVQGRTHAGILPAARPALGQWAMRVSRLRKVAQGIQPLFFSGDAEPALYNQTACSSSCGKPATSRIVEIARLTVESGAVAKWCATGLARACRVRHVRGTGLMRGTSMARTGSHSRSVVRGLSWVIFLVHPLLTEKPAERCGTLIPALGVALPPPTPDLPLPLGDIMAVSVPLPPPADRSNDAASSPPWARAKSTVGRWPGAFLAAGVSLIALLVIAVSFWVSNFNSAESWKAATYEARSDRDVVQEDLTEAESEIQTLQATSDDLQGKVSTLEGEVAAVAQEAAELDEQAAEIAQREAAVSKTEDRIAANTISEGIWTVGVDIEPGTYRTKDSPYDCYWAIYTSGTNQEDIIQNDIVAGGIPTVTLTKGQDFETSRCGDWVK